MNKEKLGLTDTLSKALYGPLQGPQATTPLPGLQRPPMAPSDTSQPPLLGTVPPMPRHPYDRDDLS
jgi:hypothetical protein